MRRPFSAFMWTPESIMRPPGPRSTMQDAPPMRSRAHTPDSRPRDTASHPAVQSPRASAAGCTSPAPRITPAATTSEPARAVPPARGAVRLRCASAGATSPPRLETSPRRRGLRRVCRRYLGPAEGDGADLFEVTVCTPRWRANFPTRRGHAFLSTPSRRRTVGRSVGEARHQRLVSGERGR